MRFDFLNISVKSITSKKTVRTNARTYVETYSLGTVSEYDLEVNGIIKLNDSVVRVPKISDFIQRLNLLLHS